MYTLALVLSQVQAAGTLLMIEFSTLSDYLFLLRGVAESLAPHGPTVMLYLAAAVSDFYIPPQDLVGHMQFNSLWNLYIV